MKLTTGQKKMSRGVTLGSQSNRSNWYLTLQVFYHRISPGLWCRGHVGLSRVIPLSDSNLFLSHYMWVHYIQPYRSTLSTQCISDFMTVGSLGNLLVLTTILRSSEMRTARNVLIGNLALSDLCLCVVTMPLTLVSENNGQDMITFSRKCNLISGWSHR